MAYILALDQGTTSSRAFLVDEAGVVHGRAQREFRQRFPQAGRVEHDADEIWASQLQVAREALAMAAVDAADVAGIGITNQRETTVVWERASGRPIGPAIVWQDRRTAPMCDELRRSEDAAEIRRRTGLELDPYFSGTKLRWMLDQDDELRRRAEAGELAFGTVDTWLVWKLTGGRVHATDPSNASRTLLFDIHELDWSPWLLEKLGVPAAVLPALVDSSGVLGETDPGLFGGAIPLAGLAGDQQAALFGQMCVQPGMVKNTYGTGCFLLMNTGYEAVPSRHGLLTTVAWRRAGRTTYALEGSVFIGGAVVQWLRDGLGLIDTSAAVEQLAASVPDTQGVYCVPAFAGLGAPHWDPYARGTIVGITRGTTAAHLARAALEGIAHQVADVVEAMHGDSGIRLAELRVDGGAAANELLLRIQAELLRMPVVRPTQLETTALGAAYLAGLATGVWSGIDELRQRWQAARRYEPQRAADAIADERRAWRRAVERAGSWAQDEEP